jgi:protoporphyrinogen oxidase
VSGVQEIAREKPAVLRWGVVGGGILGATLALRLAQQGHRVTLFEAADHLGGLADAWQVGDVVWDRHYHVTLLSDVHLRGLLAEIGLEDDMRWAETKTGFYTDGRLHSLSNTWEFLRFPPLGLVDKLRLGLTILRASRIKSPRRLERISVADWLLRWSGRRVTEKVWLPLLRSKLGESYRRTSAALIWATIARMYAARRTGLKKEMFGYVRGGYARVFARMEERLLAEGVQIEYGHAARRVASEGMGAMPTSSWACDGHGHEDVAMPPGEVMIDFANGQRHVLDRVVLTVPAPLVPRLCPDLREEEKERFGGIEYQGIVCASMLLERPLAGYYVTNITDPGLPFTAVIEMTALVDPAEFGGRTLVYLPKYVPSGDRAFSWADEEVRERFLGGLERIYPKFRRQEVVAFRVSRVRCVMPLPTLGYSERMPPVRTSLTGVYAVISAHIIDGTLNANETVRLAEEAVRGGRMKDEG